jgi:hypothetical protein
MTDPQPDIRDVELDELLGEMRRRNISSEDVLEGLGHPVRKISERMVAIGIIALITLISVGVVSWLTIDGSAVPQFFIGLTGTGLGALAGILTGSKLGSSSQESA